MCIRDRHKYDVACSLAGYKFSASSLSKEEIEQRVLKNELPVSYTHLRAHETVLDLVCRLLLEKKKQRKSNNQAI